MNNHITVHPHTVWRPWEDSSSLGRVNTCLFHSRRGNSHFIIEMSNWFLTYLLPKTTRHAKMFLRESEAFLEILNENISYFKNLTVQMKRKNSCFVWSEFLYIIFVEINIIVQTSIKNHTCTQTKLLGHKNTIARVIWVDNSVRASIESAECNIIILGLIWSILHRWTHKTIEIHLSLTNPFSTWNFIKESGDSLIWMNFKYENCIFHNMKNGWTLSNLLCKLSFSKL